MHMHMHMHMNVNMYMCMCMHMCITHVALSPQTGPASQKEMVTVQQVRTRE